MAIKLPLVTVVIVLAVKFFKTLLRVVVELRVAWLMKMGFRRRELGYTA